MTENSLIFLKLGGSLITDKNQAETVREGILHNCLAQVKRWLQEYPNAGLVLGHGSGSFGHHAAKTYHTRDGVSTKQDWLGYSEVWYSARKLNNMVIDACVSAGIPVVDFPISAGVVTENRLVQSFNLDPLKEALIQGLVPIVHGDVCIDRSLGGTILSTEEIFNYLASHFKPNRILLAGVEGGVYADYPSNQQLIPHIPVDVYLSNFLQGSEAKDVTGGMATKVTLMQEIAHKYPGTEIIIFSGLVDNSIYRVLNGEALGTCIV